MVLAILLSRVLGLVREIVIAAQFGQGQLTDIYKLAFKLPDLLNFMIAGGALSSAFVPVFTQYITQGREEEAWKIYSTIASIATVLITILIIIIEIWARDLVPIFVAPGATPYEWDRIAYLTRIILPAQLFFFIGGLTMGTLYARKEFLVPALGPIIYNIGIIIGAVWFAERVGIQALSWGALAGAFTGNLILQVWYSSRLGIRFKVCFDWRHPGVRKVFLLMLPVILGLSLPQVDVYINMWFGSFLQTGAVSALDNANRLMQVPLGIFGQAAGIAALPSLSALVAQANWKDYRETLSFGVRSVFFATIPAAAFMIVLARPIIALLMEAGEFTAQDTALAASALVYYSIGVFAWGGQALIARGFYALQDTVTPVVVGTIMTLFFIPLNWLLMQPMGHNGLALATSIMAIVHLLVMSAILARRVDGIGAWRILRSTFRIMAAAVVAAAAAWGAAALLGPLISSQLGSANTLAVKAAAAAELIPGLLVGGGVYLFACRLLKVEETGAFLSLVTRRFGRAKS